MIAYLVVVLAVSLLGSTQQPDIFSQAVGPCIGGQCQPAYACYQEQCVPQRLVPASRPRRSFSRDSAIGPCIANACPSGYFCHQAECLRQV